MLTGLLHYYYSERHNLNLKEEKKNPKLRKLWGWKQFCWAQDLSWTAFELCSVPSTVAVEERSRGWVSLSTGLPEVDTYSPHTLQSHRCSGCLVVGWCSPRVSWQGVLLGLITPECQGLWKTIIPKLCSSLCTLRREKPHGLPQLELEVCARIAHRGQIKPWILLDSAWGYLKSLKTSHPCSVWVPGKQQTHQLMALLLLPAPHHSTVQVTMAAFKLHRTIYLDFSNIFLFGTKDFTFLNYRTAIQTRKLR